MNYILELIIEIILITFPILLYLFFGANARNHSKTEKLVFLDIALYTSLYLIAVSEFNDNALLLLLINIPLLICYLKKRIFAATIISIIIAWFHTDLIPISLTLIIIEYILYFVISQYLIKKRKDIYNMIIIFTIIKSFTFSYSYILYFNISTSYISGVLHLLALMIVFYIVTSGVFYLLSKGEDIMDLNSTIKELEKEKMLRASLFKITHEIKNPIAVCKGYLDMLDLKDEKKLYKYIPIVKQEISRTLTLMDDYLDYTKIKIQKEPVDLYMLIEETCSSLESLFNQNQITTDIKIPDEELYMELDYNRLKQVLVNIFKNAMEAKKEHEKMTISLSIKAENEEVIIKIKDSGIGMDKETLEKVSEMFYTTKQKGTGLGVSLSKEIIELHGGKLKYCSTVNKGTSVYITLPNKNQSQYNFD